MPNWCSNTLTIYGDAATRAALEEKMKEAIADEGLFNAFIPYPEGLAPNKEHYRKGMTIPRRLQGRRLMSSLEVAKLIRERMKKTTNTNIEKAILKEALDYYAIELMCGDTEHMYDAEMIETHLADNSYDWHNINCGTKWDITEASINNDDGTLSVGFDSAWAPPLLAIQQISKQYPSLLFHMWYNEGGCAIYGACVFANGVKVIKGKDFDWSVYDEDEIEDKQGEIEDALFDEISSDAFCRSAWYELRSLVDAETKQRINTHLGLKVRKLRVKGCACSEKKICHEHYCYGCDQHEDDCECDHQCDEDDCKLCRRGIYCDCADKACPYCCRT